MAFGDHCGEMSRWITAQCCENMVEMIDDPMNNLCCGAGGGAWAGPYAQERIDFGKWKADQIKATGAEMVVAACHNCRDQIKKSLTKEFDLGIETKYVWELVSDSLIIKPWTKTEITKARKKRDAQFERDGIDLEELSS